MNWTTDAIEDLANPFENGQDATPEDDNDEVKGRRSLRKAIDLNCKWCIYDDQVKGEGTWREQVFKCTVTKCALYPVRPVSKPRKNTELLPEAPGATE